jgi:hypothetical protein
MSPDEKKVRAVARATAKADQMANDDSAAKGDLDVTQRDASISSMAAKIEYVPRIKWLDLSAQIFIHVGFLYGFYLVLTQASWLTALWGKASFSVFVFRSMAREGPRSASREKAGQSIAISRGETWRCPVIRPILNTSSKKSQLFAAPYRDEIACSVVVKIGDTHWVLQTKSL